MLRRVVTTPCLAYTGQTLVFIFLLKKEGGNSPPNTITCTVLGEGKHQGQEEVGGRRPSAGLAPNHTPASRLLPLVGPTVVIKSHCVHGRLWDRQIRPVPNPQKKNSAA